MQYNVGYMLLEEGVTIRHICGVWSITTLTLISGAYRNQWNHADISSGTYTFLPDMNFLKVYTIIIHPLHLYFIYSLHLYTYAFLTV